MIVRKKDSSFIVCNIKRRKQTIIPSWVDTFETEKKFK